MFAVVVCLLAVYFQFVSIICILVVLQVCFQFFLLFFSIHGIFKYSPQV